ncbi:hypothetical protein ScPMuIL_011915 [Solemya velum]
MEPVKILVWGMHATVLRAGLVTTALKWTVVLLIHVQTMEPVKILVWGMHATVLRAGLVTTALKWTVALLIHVQTMEPVRILVRGTHATVPGVGLVTTALKWTVALLIHVQTMEPVRILVRDTHATVLGAGLVTTALKWTVALLIHVQTMEPVRILVRGTDATVPRAGLVTTALKWTVALLIHVQTMEPVRILVRDTHATVLGAGLVTTALKWTVVLLIHVQIMEPVRILVQVDSCSSNPCTNNGACQNLGAGYACNCTWGWIGHNCSEEEIMLLDDLGDGVKDRMQERMWELSLGPVGILYLGRIYKKLYVSVNGYISLGRKFDSVHPPVNGSWSEDIPILAPFWSDLELGNNGSDLFISSLTQNLEKYDKLVHASEQNFSSTNVVVVTWMRVSPYPARIFSKFGNMTFQVVLLSDSRTGHTYVVYNYDRKHMAWDWEKRHILVSLTQDQGPHIVASTEQKNTLQMIMNGTNFGENGRWIWDVSGLNPEPNKEYTCRLAVNRTKVQTNTASCPCLLQHVKLDHRYKKDGSQNCYKFHNYTNGQNVNVTCCYDSQYGILNTGGPSASFMSSTIRGDKKSVHKIAEGCCSNDGSPCEQVFSYQPSDDCITSTHMQIGHAWGNFHITTLDGNTYTFNDEGDFMLLKIDELFQIQIRTEMFGDHNASALTRIVAKETFSDMVEMFRDEECLKFNYVTGEKGDCLLDSEISFYNVTILRDDLPPVNSKNPVNAKKLYVVFHSGIQLNVREHIGERLSVTVHVPDMYKGRVTGLLGLYDGNSTNDFQLSNGSSITVADSKTQNIVPFQRSWFVNSSQILFTAPFNKTDFTPAVFSNLADNLTTLYSDNQTKQQAIGICGDSAPCFIDFAVTNNSTVASSTRMEEKNFEIKRLILGDKPPVFAENHNLSDTWFIDRGQHLTWTIQSEPQSERNITLKIDTNIFNYTFDSLTGKFIWNVENPTNASLYLKFIAEDDLNISTVYWPFLNYCPCEKSYQCVGREDLFHHYNKDRFQRLQCQCDMNYTGDFCEQEVDKCKIGACFPDVKCNSTEREPCGECPSNLDGDGEHCYYVNKCYTEHNCSDYCKDDEGVLVCYCKDGYQLKSDNKTCEEIMKCQLQYKYCTEQGQYCHRRDAADYECLCATRYFKKDGSCIKAPFVFGGRITFGAIQNVEWKDSLNDTESSYFKETAEIVVNNLTEALKGMKNFIGVEVQNFYKIEYSRKKREATQQSQFGANIAFSFTEPQNSDAIGNTIKTELHKNCPMNSSCPYGEFVQDDSGSCWKNDCNSMTTSCETLKSGSFDCQCKPGYERNEKFQKKELAKHNCEDIDECNDGYSCLGGKCINTIGNWTCECPDGYRQQKSTANHKEVVCKNQCEPNPCQNGGTCAPQPGSNSYICRCSDGYQGQKCDADDPAVSRYRTIVIAVGASLGALCLLLLVSMLGICRRNMARMNKFSETESNTNRYSHWSGSIPRPKIHANGNDMEMVNKGNDRLTRSSQERMGLTHASNPLYSNQSGSKRNSEYF